MMREEKDINAKIRAMNPDDLAMIEVATSGAMGSPGEVCFVPWNGGAIRAQACDSVTGQANVDDELIKALRRFITRYLLGDKNILIDLKDENLINEFYRSDLWGIKEMKEFDKIKILLKIRLKDINIKINQALSLYENIGQKDRENVKDFIKEIQKNKEDNESGSEDEGLE